MNINNIQKFQRNSSIFKRVRVRKAEQIARWTDDDQTFGNPKLFCWKLYSLTSMESLKKGYIRWRDMQYLDKYSAYYDIFVLHKYC